jgi:hypothetical protein
LAAVVSGLPNRATSEEQLRTSDDGKVIICQARGSVRQKMMNNSATSRTAARLSLGLSVTFLVLLTVLHVLEPEFNSGHLISEYQLGDYGFLMSLAFCLLGASATLVALSLGPRLQTRGGRVGWWGLLLVGAAFLVGGSQFTSSITISLIDRWRGDICPNIW